MDMKSVQYNNIKVNLIYTPRNHLWKNKISDTLLVKTDIPPYGEIVLALRFFHHLEKKITNKRIRQMLVIYKRSIRSIINEKSDFSTHTLS